MRKLAIVLGLLFLISLSPLKVFGSAMTSVNKVEINLGKWEPSEEYPPSVPKPPEGESVIETIEQKKLPQTDEKAGIGYVLAGYMVIVVASIAIYYNKVKYKKLT